MRTLHVAALPFPSPQGTQALLHQMLSALARAGHDTHLLCYAHGAQVGAPEARPYTVHRSSSTGFTRSLRSGPSLDKLWLDAALARELPRLVRRLAPSLLVAHHVEGAALVGALHGRDFTFVAHTSLREELPSYFSPLLAPGLRRAGTLLDRALLRRAGRCLAVSPLLATLLSAQSGVPVAALPLPWQSASALGVGEREIARRALQLEDGHEVALYAGNLDAYQGLEPLVAALAGMSARRPQLRLLIATAASQTALARQLQQVGLRQRVVFAPLDDEPARRRAHAAADFALIPRRSAGGLPIKLLEAFARGLPVVAAARALAGLPLERECMVVDGDSARAWQQGIEALLDHRDEARRRAEGARCYLEREHTTARFVAALLQR
ncbi:MAG: glycosyl transferase group 1 [Myxococcaceae bacterium]|nr:glycosyl transferase group 1 [Myxococcaceae bacterium]